MSVSPFKPYHHGNLRHDLLAMGECVLAEQGAGGLSLREVARRLQVSHNAPYKHFPTREALLAGMAEAGFEILAERLARAGDGLDDVAAMAARGLAYVTFALERPAVFRLMFSGEIDRAAFPDLQARASETLHAVVGRIHRAFGEAALEEATLGAWAFVHGLTSLMLDGQVPSVLRAGRSDEELAKATLAVMLYAIAGERR